MIETKRLSVRFEKTVALDDVTLCIEGGKITTIIGPNGSGKTTLLRCMMGFAHTQAGEVLFDGRNAKSIKVKEFAKLVAYSPQFHHPPALATVEQLIGYGRNPYAKFLSQHTSEDKAVVEWTMEETGLADKRHNIVSKLSGGERQRAFIAMSLAQKTKYLLLDEPINNLDIAYQMEILDLLKTLNKRHGLTIVMVLHDINLAVRYSDSVAVLSQGRLIETGESRAVIRAEILESAFGIKADIEQRGSEIIIIPKSKYTGGM